MSTKTSVTLQDGSKVEVAIELGETLEDLQAIVADDIIAGLACQQAGSQLHNALAVLAKQDGTNEASVSAFVETWKPKKPGRRSMSDLDKLLSKLDGNPDLKAQLIAELA